MLSEAVDWLVYTFSKRPFRSRVLLSSSISVPLDSAVFLWLVGSFAWPLLAIQIASKMAACIVLLFEPGRKSRAGA
jgi:hypothetical protein